MNIDDIKSTVKRGARTRVTFDLNGEGIRNVKISASNPQARDEAMERLRRVLPWFEMLEAQLLNSSGDPGEKRPHV